MLTHDTTRIRVFIARTAILLIVILCFVWSAWLSTRPVTSGVASGSRIVRPGILHKWIVDKNGPWRIQVVEVDLKRPELHIESARANDSFFGRERLSSIVARKSDTTQYVVVALNGDYFNLETGEVQNNHILAGTFVKGFASPGSHPEYVDIPNSQFAITSDKRPLIDQFVFSGQVLWKDGSSDALSGVNIFPKRGGLVLFNQYAGERMFTENDSIAVAEALLRIVRRNSDTLVCVGIVPTANKTGRPIVYPAVVLAAYKQSVQTLSARRIQGDTIRIVLGMQPNGRGIRDLIGGWPRIVRNGESLFDDRNFPENPEATIFAKRHPRSGIGCSRDSTTLFLITVDGRQKGSVGMSLAEFARLMISLGVYEGLNLDGGGSSTMVINGEIVNSPSDPTGERPIGNCLLLVAEDGVRRP